MKLLMKRVCTLMVLAFLALSVTQAHEAHSEELTAAEKALAFIRDVVEFDLAKYNVTQSGYGLSYPSSYGGLSDELVKYTLESEESKLEVVYGFINGTFTDYNLYVLRGSPQYAETQPSSVFVSAKALAERYQAHAQASYLQSMIDLLNRVSPTENTTTLTSGNLKIDASIAGNNASVRWLYTSNGLDFRGKGVYLKFVNGSLRSFVDGWRLYKIGSDETKVSKEDAIGIALDRARNYKLRAYVGPNASLTEVPFNIVENLTHAELSTVSREPFTLYPFWHVQIYFDKLYSTANGIEVGIWADTGEVVYCQATGIAGDSGDSATQPSESASSSPTTQSAPSPSPSSTPANPTSSPPSEQTPNENTPKENSTMPPINTYIAVAAAAIFISAAIAAIALKKKEIK